MTWLLKLYPPGWRRRYGEELAELVAAQPFSLGGALDLVAGAIDAWCHPQLAGRATPGLEGGATMVARMLHLKCAGYGPEVAAGDRARATAMNIGGTLVLALLWLWVLWQSGKNAYVLAIGPLTYFLPYLLGLRYTSLKGRSAGAQATIIVGGGAALAAFLLLVQWAAARVWLT